MKNNTDTADGGGNKWEVASEMRSLLWILASISGSQWTYCKGLGPVLRVSSCKYNLKPCFRKGLKVKVGDGGRFSMPPMPLSSLDIRYNRISYLLQSRLLSALCPFCTHATAQSPLLLESSKTLVHTVISKHRFCVLSSSCSALNLALPQVHLNRGGGCHMLVLASKGGG